MVPLLSILGLGQNLEIGETVQTTHCLTLEWNSITCFRDTLKLEGPKMIQNENAPTKCSDYLNDCYRNFSMYVLQTRAFPNITDGLKSGARRLLWTGKNGAKQKTATLAGAAMPLHPHGDSSDTIDTMTKPFRNNYPLFTGHGSFGTLLKPDASGAPRYTAVEVSEFTKDVVFRDIEIVPMCDNYDGTLKEPVHFLPLVPLVYVNPSEGIGVGFSSTILPRALGDVIDSQIAYLNGKKFEEPPVYFAPYDSKSVRSEVIKSGNVRWWFSGKIKRLDTSTVVVEGLPYGQDHTSYVEVLSDLLDNGIVTGVDDNSSESIAIQVKFPRGSLKDLTDEQVISKLKLNASVVENVNVVDFGGDKVTSPSYVELIAMFTSWRLGWYVNRFQRLKEQIEREIQRYRDIINAIENDVGKKGREAQDRSSLITWLELIGVVYTDYIADMPIYRLTVQEAAKARSKLDEALVTLGTYQSYLDSEDKRKQLYIKELKEVKKKHA